MSSTIVCNAAFPADIQQLLIDRTRPHRLVFSKNLLTSNLQSGGGDPEARSAEILFGQPNPEDLLASQHVRWVHLHSAGYTRYERDDLRSAMKQRGAIMTNSSTVFADPCAQHVLAFMLAGSRAIPESITAQQQDHSWKYRELRPKVRVLTGETAVIFGLGAIGRRLIELLSPYRMKLIGVRRRPRGDESIATISPNQIDEFLPQADHVINVLPAGSESVRFFNADRFARMKPSTSFYNIGRGDTLDQPALVEALRSGGIVRAFLDVTTPEPLPSDDALWSAPNCYITPHVAGGHQDELRHLVEHFLENLSRLDRGEQLLDRIM
jgi:phosphoglycerate dehydrogenase-like enzyme